MTSRSQRILLQVSINLIFTYLQKRTRVEIWLYDNTDVRIEGRIIGFDEYSNLVLDDVEEVNVKSGRRVALGRILQKGDTVTLICPAPAQKP